MFRSPTPSPFVDRSTFDKLTRVISDHKRDCNGIAEQVAQNRKDLGIQFDRIAQLQAQMDNVEVLLKMLLATRPLTLPLVSPQAFRAPTQSVPDPTL